MKAFCHSDIYQCLKDVDMTVEHYYKTGKYSRKNLHIKVIFESCYIFQ